MNIGAREGKKKIAHKQYQLLLHTRLSHQEYVINLSQRYCAILVTSQKVQPELCQAKLVITSLTLEAF